MSYIIYGKTEELKPQKQQLRLQTLSETRWACRHSAVNVICCTYDAVVVTLLLAVTNDHDGKCSVEARGLIYQVISF